ncbi:hypothetical protein ASE00_00515 [Sphingomonas sp. Root710]|uniref:hypothetical protein n=1 Tax=Sphingomonas sp. Root710 TaxID=1736594 RepID=UPI0006F976B1|nr:hypothetical protein [Sphingomonas sp. Root710]KRB85326.1 hypothetical protein ASE00_00515 [Sphingomonas sp. Root710]
MADVLTSPVTDRLSVSQVRKYPPRPLTLLEVETLRRVADALIPPGDGVLSGSAIPDFEALVTKAVAILDKGFPQLVATLAELAPVPSGDLWPTLQALAARNEPAFYTLSTTVAGAYLYSKEVREQLNYPLPHRNPPGFFDAADELSSGILDPVMAGGFSYRTAD